MRKQYLASFIDQGTGAALAFGINLWLIRNNAAGAYGVFVFWYGTAIIGGSVLGALVQAHLFPLPPGREYLAQRREPEQVLLTVMLAFGGLLGAGVLVGSWLFYDGADGIWQPEAALYVAGYALAQYARNLIFSRGLVMPATTMTCGTAIVVAGGFAIDWAIGIPETPARVLLLVGATYSISAVIVLVCLGNEVRPSFTRRVFLRYLSYLRDSGWLLLGAVSGEMLGRLYGFVVVGNYGASALARLSAAQVAIRPAWMLVSAWGSVGRARISGQRARGDRRGIMRTLLTGAIATASGSLAWGVVTIAGWPIVSGVLYRGRYEDARDLAILWTANAVIGSITLSLNTALTALGAFRELAFADLAGAVVGAALTLFAVPHLGAGFSIVAIVAGQLTQSVLMAMLVLQKLRPARLHPTEPALAQG